MKAVLFISLIADKIYPFLKDREVRKLDSVIAKNISKNVYALIFQRIGEVIVYATDDIIISNLNSRLKIIHCSQSFDFSNFLQNSV